MAIEVKIRKAGGCGAGSFKDLGVSNEPKPEWFKKKITIIFLLFYSVE